MPRFDPTEFDRLLARLTPQELCQAEGLVADARKRAEAVLEFDARADVRPNARKRIAADGRKMSNTAPRPRSPTAAAAVMNQPDTPRRAAPMTRTVKLSAAPRIKALRWSRRISRKMNHSAFIPGPQAGRCGPSAAQVSYHGLQ